MREHIPSMDILAEVINQLTVSAHVFHSGALCGISAFEDHDASYGHIHVLKHGHLTLQQPDMKTISISEPSLIFFPGPSQHRLITRGTEEVDLVCATVHIGASTNNPLANALPKTVVIPLSQSDMICRCVTWLFDEAFNDSPGKQPMLNKLSEIVVINLIRHESRQQEHLPGILRAMSHPQISRVINAVHVHPNKKWDLNEMGAIAAMSRSKFAATFKEVVGQTPADYVNDWRISVSQVELAKGSPVNVVANKVGYETNTSFSRAFKKKTGQSPMHWQKSRLAS